MKSKRLTKWCRLLVLLMAIASGFTLIGKTYAQALKVKNVVIVHGAFADASGWQGVYRELTQKGYNVTLVQNPCTSLKEDVDATNFAIDKMDGPVILVGHSWGGTVITQAGVHPKVAALVYVNAFQPEIGENTVKLASSAPPKPENGLLPPDEKGNVYYSKEKFHAGFCADVSDETAEFMFASSGFIPAEAFGTPVTEAAWKNKPTYGISSEDDKSINPVITMNGYERSNSIVTRLKGSHVVFMTHPQEVAAVIMTAAQQISK
ncbi:alpha/beta hydrolase [Mucilaginibacter sp. P19]|uniref:Pimeloyl-ACP methyl ester carboxylesterase n=1 Tax=Mucilaginibacter gossypii TaxID=551996 RepID=A0A1G8CZW2_9SPHI|nr:alpha/beta hydrolase [Mucilaginibacter gossypii]SDH51056.1 Pimeloyl-ACP methyl ester carboxylesterase [Mucilaginibacter gossypii]